MENQMISQFNNEFNQIKANAESYIHCMENYARHFKTNHVMVTAGMDFAWLFAHVNFEFFENVTALYANHKLGSRFKFMFSTVDEYFKAILAK